MYFPVILRKDLVKERTSSIGATLKSEI